jgi:hypothetical protein
MRQILREALPGVAGQVSDCVDSDLVELRILKARMDEFQRLVCCNAVETQALNDTALELGPLLGKPQDLRDEGGIAGMQQPTCYHSGGIIVIGLVIQVSFQVRQGIRRGLREYAPKDHYRELPRSLVGVVQERSQIADIAIEEFCVVHRPHYGDLEEKT